jgi:uncharacterized RDD family membrane protein YckC
VNPAPGTLVIRTPEGIAFGLPLAGPLTRFLAWAVDTAVILTIVSVLSSLLTPVAILLNDLGGALFIMMLFVVQFGYGIALEWWRDGQTIGKWLLRLRVIDESGLRLAFSQVVVRNLLRMVDALPALFLLGGVVSLLNARSQRLGDIAAGTVVVRQARVADPDLSRAGEIKYNSFRDHPHLCARLRQAAPPELARVALDALNRRDTLDPDARVALFADIADALRQHARFPEEATFGLTPEQYTRNAVDVLFRR